MGIELDYEDHDEIVSIFRLGEPKERIARRFRLNGEVLEGILKKYIL